MARIAAVPEANPVGAVSAHQRHSAHRYRAGYRSQRFAWKLPAERRRHRVAIGLFGHLGKIREEALKGAHRLPAL